MIVYLGWLLVVLGVAQLYAGAGGVDRTSVRIGTGLVVTGLMIVAAAVTIHLAE